MVGTSSGNAHARHVKQLDEEMSGVNHIIICVMLAAPVGVVRGADQEPDKPRRIVLTTAGNGLLKIHGVSKDVQRFHERWSETIDDLLVIYQDLKDIRIYPIRHVAVADAADMVDAMFNDRQRQTALIHLLRQKQHQERRIQLDAASTAAPPPAAMRAAGVEADLTAGASLAAAAGQGYEVRIFADTVGRQLVVNAREQDHHQIAQLLQHFDAPRIQALRVIKLKHLAPADVEKFLDNLQNARHNALEGVHRNVHTRGRLR